jgi:hypothetical protein
MLYDDQMLLVDDGQVGDRLGDHWLMPAPLRRIVDNSNVLACGVWPGLLPELLAKPAGRA